MDTCFICRMPIPDGTGFCEECESELDGSGTCVGEDLTGLVIKDTYKLVEKIGEGNSGEVYQAIHQELKRQVEIGRASCRERV